MLLLLHISILIPLLMRRMLFIYFGTLLYHHYCFQCLQQHVPDHAKLIPGDAAVVAGINTGEIGKKIAWNAILGSKLFDEMKQASA